ncbi:MAG: DUF1460 domain-containing protein [Rickettsiales bacterium]|nr:MAG: DUF1460 domain-containing protein [Rickettsiales bacterium]
MRDKIYIFAVVMNNPQVNEKTNSEHNIAHLGFIYVKGDEIHLRHASSVNKIVEDVNFIDYANSKKNSNIYIGFNLYELK